MSHDNLLIEREIARAHARYAHALDTRDWSILDSVFDEQAVACYGPETRCSGRAAIVSSIRSFLDRCGPTQHMLGNLYVDVESGRAHSRCSIRAAHQGLGDMTHLTFEAFGRYEAVWVCSTGSWRAVEWNMIVGHQTGSQEIFARTDESIS